MGSHSISGVGSVGFVGLGNIGLPMATCLVESGFSVRGWDLREGAQDRFRRAGGVVGESAANVARDSTHVAVAVYEPKADLAVVQELLPAMRPGAQLIVHSTVTPAVILSVSELSQAHRIHVVDAMVSGGDVAAKRGELVIMVGGDADDIDACAPIFDALAAKVFRTWRLGSAAAAKLCNNLMLFVNNAGICEALDLASSYGLAEDLVLAIAKAGSGRSWALDHWDRQGDLLVGARAHGTEAGYEDLVKICYLPAKPGPSGNRKRPSPRLQPTNCNVGTAPATSRIDLQ